jgi:acylphosphatase
MMEMEKVFGMLVRARIVVTGRVQRVSYRLSTLEKAKKFGVKGWIHNLPDGCVEAIIEGNDGRVRRLIRWMRRGPDLAIVQRIWVRWLPFVGDLKDFRVLR